MSQRPTHRVLRLPGAPPRRAGRAWPEGQVTDCALAPAQAQAIAADPGYRLEALPQEVPALPPRRTGGKVRG